MRKGIRGVENRRTPGSQEDTGIHERVISPLRVDVMCSAMSCNFARKTDLGASSLT